MDPYHFLVLGDEARQCYLAGFLREAGQEVMQAGEYRPGYHDAVFLPVPQTAKYLEDNFEKFQRGQIIYGCNFPEQFLQAGEERGLFFVDYMKVPGAASRNAVATAEGAVAEALQAGCRCIQGSRILVTGFGCCGEVLAEKLVSLQACVTVAERKEEKRARARAFGCDAVGFEEICGRAGEYDFVFNTVPAMVLSEDFLAGVKQDVTIIDIASRPGGVDFEFCRKNGINANLCLGLPGKYAPKSSAEILMEVIEVKFPFTCENNKGR